MERRKKWSNVMEDVSYKGASIGKGLEQKEHDLIQNMHDCSTGRKNTSDMRKDQGVRK